MFVYVSFLILVFVETKLFIALEFTFDSKLENINIINPNCSMGDSALLAWITLEINQQSGQLIDPSY